MTHLCRCSLCSRICYPNSEHDQFHSSVGIAPKPRAGRRRNRFRFSTGDGVYIFAKGSTPTLQLRQPHPLQYISSFFVSGATDRIWPWSLHQFASRYPYPLFVPSGKLYSATMGHSIHMLSSHLSRRLSTGLLQWDFPIQYFFFGIVELSIHRFIAIFWTQYISLYHGHLTIHTLSINLHLKSFSQAGPNSFLSSVEYITIFPRVTLLGHEAGHSNPFSAEVKNERSCNSKPPLSFMVRS